ncbi:hypothetical protein K491DRAFT_723690 [Lophiostoma macrostomum CBS 122681]|uniref:Uncharacterized protein n=1 Tax=Lophiostoma macrostomum CBS 122681 TaxID=1314788 RepID=A0A6A6SL89_9PLEO|nr:hypothetical protein K491DRAFT_723690 [Lophiostoma macrostomum CBS 122681]
MAEEEIHGATKLQEIAKTALNLMTNEPNNQRTPMTLRHSTVRRRRQKKIFLRIRKDIWNEYDPYRHGTYSGREKPTPRITLKVPVPQITQSTQNHATSKGKGKKKYASSATRRKHVVTLRLPKSAEQQHTRVLPPSTTSTLTAGTSARPLAPAPTSTLPTTQPDAAPIHARTPVSKVRPSLDHSTSQLTQHSHPHPRSRPRIRACNIKLTRWIPGGRHRSLKGQDMATMYLEQPCLQPGCKSCAYWFPHLIDDSEEWAGRIETVTFGDRSRGETDVCEGWAEKEMARRRPVVEALSLGGKPQMSRAKRRLGSLALPPQVVSSHGHIEAEIGRPPEVMLPTTLVSRALAPKTPARTGWRSTPRVQYVAKLKFRSKEGRETFAALVEKGEEFDRMRALRRVVGKRDDGERKGILKAQGGAKRKAENAGDESAPATKRVRFRHRVKLGFKSEAGKERFRGIVEGL